MRHILKFVEKGKRAASDSNSQEGTYRFFTSSKKVLLSKYSDYNGKYIMLSEAGTCNVSIYEGEFAASDGVLLYKNSDRVLPEYIYYWILGNSEYISRDCYKGMGLKHIDRDKFSSQVVYIPTIEEQIKIVSQLDKLSLTINNTFQELEFLYKNVSEYKKALVVRTTTSVLISSQKKNKVKKSNIPWVDNIPYGWDLVSLGNVTTHIKNNKNTGLVETNLLSISHGKIIKKNIFSNVGLMPESFETYQIVKKGDIVFRPTDLQNDKTSLRSALAEENGIVSSAYIVIRTNGLEPRYLNYLLRGYDYSKVYYTLGSGTRQSFKFEDLKNIPILIPPINEQVLIANSLDEEFLKIESLLNSIKDIQHLVKPYLRSKIRSIVNP
jgi:type I restriction enzyme S subunit